MTETIKPLDSWCFQILLFVMLVFRFIWHERNEMFKIYSDHSPSICISLDILLTSSWERPSVSTTSTLGMPLRTPASSVKMASFTCLMARPESRVINIDVTAWCQEQDLHHFTEKWWILQEHASWQSDLHLPEKHISLKLHASTCRELEWRSWNDVVKEQNLRP